MKWSRRDVWVATVLAAITVLAFWPTLGNDFVGYDDELYVTANAVVQRGLTAKGIVWAFSTFEGSNWHPVTWLLHMLDCSLFGLDPVGHHAMSLAWHVVGAVLLYILLRLATGARWPSAVVAALFALHPLHVESVAWVAERKDVASAAFGLGSLVLYVLWTRRRTASLYGACVATFGVGLLIKPMLVTLPFVMLLLDHWPLGRWSGAPTVHRAWWNGLLPRVREKTPLLILTAASSAVTFVAQRSGGAVESLDMVPLWARLANAALSYGTYLGKTVWPANLAIHYPHPGTSISGWLAGGAGVVLIGLTVVAARAATRFGWLWVGWCWFVGTMVPVIGLVQVGSQAMADRYTYLPLIGIFIAVVWTADHSARGSKDLGVALVAASVVVLTVLGTLTWHQLRHWKDGVAIFSHAARVAAPNALAEYKLGVAFAARGEHDRALARYQRAVEINPSSGSARLAFGTALLNRGETDRAMEHFDIAARAPGTRARAHNNLGIALERKQEPGKAIVHYRAAIHLDPELTDAHINLGVLQARQGKLDEAAGRFERVIELEPLDADAHNNLGFVRWQQGHLDEAIARFQRALAIEPGLVKAQNNLKRVWHERASGAPAKGATETPETQ